MLLYIVNDVCNHLQVSELIVLYIVVVTTS